MQLPADLLQTLFPQIQQKMTAELAKSLAQFSENMKLSAIVQAFNSKQITLQTDKGTLKLPSGQFPQLHPQSKVVLEIVQKQPELLIKLHSIQPAKDPKAPQLQQVDVRFNEAKPQQVAPQLASRVATLTQHYPELKQLTSTREFPAQFVKAEGKNIFPQEIMQRVDKGEMPRDLLPKIQQGKVVVPSVLTFPAATASEAKPILQNFYGIFMIMRGQNLPKEPQIVNLVVDLKVLADQSLKPISENLGSNLKNISQLNKAWEAVKQEVISQPFVQAVQTQFSLRQPLMLVMQIFKMLNFVKGGGEVALPVPQMPVQTTQEQNMMDQLMRFFTDQSDYENKSENQNWRFYSLPILNGDKFDEIDFYQKRSKRNKEDQEHRFVIELNLSLYGEIQLDGYYQKKNLLLKVKTHQELKNEDKTSLFEKFTEITEQFSIRGKLMFEVWKDIPKPYLKEE